MIVILELFHMFFSELGLPGDPDDNDHGKYSTYFDSVYILNFNMAAFNHL